MGNINKTLTDVQDFRKCSRKELTTQQISSRIHLVQDQIIEQLKELKELKSILEGLQEELINRRIV